MVAGPHYNNSFIVERADLFNSIFGSGPSDLYPILKNKPGEYEDAVITKGRAYRLGIFLCLFFIELLLRLVGGLFFIAAGE
jgi:hypothetical protein